MKKSVKGILKFFEILSQVDLERSFQKTKKKKYK